MAAIRTQLEDAVVAKLASLSAASGGYLRAIEPYNGEVEAAEGIDDLKRRLSGRAPAVLVAAGPSSTEVTQLQRRRGMDAITVELWVVSNHARSREARTRGDALSAQSGKDPGIYQVLEDVRLLLFGEPSGVAGAGRFEPQGDTPVVRTADLCVWRQAYTVAVEITPDPLGDADEQYTTIRHEHNLPAPDDAENPVIVADTPV